MTPYSYNDNPVSLQWEAAAFPSTYSQPLFIPTPNQANIIEDLTQKILNSPSVPLTDQVSLQQTFNQLQNTPEQGSQLNLLITLRNTLPSDPGVQQKLQAIETIYNSITPTPHFITTTQTIDLKTLHHAKQSPSSAPPQQAPVEKTTPETFNTAGFEEKPTSSDTPSCSVIGDPCCPGKLCQNNLKCKGMQGCQPCTPECNGKSCGNNGCGGSCGDCGPGTNCQNDHCVPVVNTEIICGDGSCQSGENCGTCSDCSCLAGQTCSNGQCLNVCIFQCTGKACGDDGCGGSCGTCQAGQSCDNGQCVSPTNTCTPSCQIQPGTPAPCGFPDGCGGLCPGPCVNPKTCNQGQCVTDPTCTPQCEGKICGDDNGCGGPCTVQTCVAPRPYCIQGACVGLSPNLAAVFQHNLQNTVHT